MKQEVETEARPSSAEDFPSLCQKALDQVAPTVKGVSFSLHNIGGAVIIAAGGHGGIMEDVVFEDEEPTALIPSLVRVRALALALHLRMAARKN